MIEFIGRCFFCEKAVAVRNNSPSTPEGARKFIRKYGDMEQLGGHIGKKLICKSCVRSIASLIEYSE